MVLALVVFDQQQRRTRRCVARQIVAAHAQHGPGQQAAVHIDYVEPVRARGLRAQKMLQPLIQLARMLRFKEQDEQCALALPQLAVDALKR